MVVLVVVYVASVSRQDRIMDVRVDYQDPPTVMPSQAPTTNREASGIIEQLEMSVLNARNESWNDMEVDDPRVLALDWILHKDAMQLVSDDANLHQRFALAVLAYAMDSTVWYVCGDPGANYTEGRCSIPIDENTTTTSGTWLAGTSECTWFGVTCSADGVVRGVDLSYNDLVGTLPHELSALEFVQFLHLARNCIYGTIPPELGKMRHLMSLELNENGLSGAMPAELYDLRMLQTLNLAFQWGMPLECKRSDGSVVDTRFRMGGLLQRRELNAGLTGALGPEIGAWPSMKGLFMSKNSFEGEISDEIGKLRYLRNLWLDDNFIGGSLPKTITRLRNLKTLQLNDNFLISSLPTDIGRMEDLKTLTVNGNSMFGEIPSGLYKLTKMQKLRLDNTLMSEAPWLVVPDEGFNGTISTRLGRMQDLQWLILSNNPLSGTIPTELGSCEKLEKLWVQKTNISGTMPNEICLLRDKNLNSPGDKASVLSSDCLRVNRTGDPFLKCDCCSDCCDHLTGVCIADD